MTPEDAEKIEALRRTGDALWASLQSSAEKAEALRHAGDALYDSLRRAPGIDPMRAVLLAAWLEARHGI